MENPASCSAVDLLETARRLLTEWTDRQSHDRCWYYPDVFDQLCVLLGVSKPERPVLPPRAEFEEGCRRYQREQFGPRNSSPDSHASSSLCWLHSSDPQEPLDRLIVERGEFGLVSIYEARMTSRSASAQVLEYHDKIFLTPEMALWLREALNAIHLDDHPAGTVDA